MKFSTRHGAAICHQRADKKNIAAISKVTQDSAVDIQQIGQVTAELDRLMADLGEALKRFKSQKTRRQVLQSTVEPVILKKTESSYLAPQ